MQMFLEKQQKKQVVKEQKLNKKRQEAMQRFNNIKTKLERVMDKMIKKRLVTEQKFSKQKEERKQKFIRAKAKLAKALEKRDKKKVLVMPCSMKISKK